LQRFQIDGGPFHAAPRTATHSAGLNRHLSLPPFLPIAVRLLSCGQGNSVDKIQVGNLVVAVSDKGNGPPVVLLHGLACGRRMWFHQTLALRHRFRVIAYDQRGHGETDAPVVATEYSAALFARDLVGVLDALKIERAAIVGFSLGGGPALALATGRPERVSRLVLADVGAGADDPLKIEWMARRWVSLIDRGEVDELVCDMLRSELLKVYARSNARRREHMAGLIRATPINGLRFTLSEVLAKRKSLFRLTGVLQSVRAPTLVMAGEQDYVCSKAARLLAQTIPNASLKIIADSGHMSPLEQPAAFSAALMEFLG
jgi:pimeloyl-ACP methyl ester carboxylesterase